MFYSSNQNQFVRPTDIVPPSLCVKFGHMERIPFVRSIPDPAAIDRIYGDVARLLILASSQSESHSLPEDSGEMNRHVVDCDDSVCGCDIYST